MTTESNPYHLWIALTSNPLLDFIIRPKTFRDRGRTHARELLLKKFEEDSFEQSDMIKFLEYVQEPIPNKIKIRIRQNITVAHSLAQDMSACLNFELDKPDRLTVSDIALSGIHEKDDKQFNLVLRHFLESVYKDLSESNGNSHEVAQSSASAARDADKSKRQRVDSLTDCSEDFAFDLADGWTAPLVRRRMEEMIQWRKAGITDPIKYSFRAVPKGPETNIVDILIKRSFIDKTQAYKKLLSNKSIITCWICGPRRFGKSTLLSMFRFILSPLHGIRMKVDPMDIQNAFQIVGGLTAGKNFLSMPVRPVLYLSSNNIDVVKDLKSEILDSFNKACFPASIPVEGTKKMNCSQFFNHCWKELLKYWRSFVPEGNPDISLRPLILWDEFDYPWRKTVYRQSSRKVVEEITKVLQFIKSVLSDSDIIIVTLLRIASIGLSTLNTLNDVMILSKYYDIIGITKEEFSHAIRNSSCQTKSFVRICKHIYGHLWGTYNEETVEEMFWKWLKLTYNGFRFALYGSPQTLYNPLDLLTISTDIFDALGDKLNLTDKELKNIQVADTLRFPWLENIRTTFGEVLSQHINRDMIIDVIRGGTCSKEELHVRLPINDYKELNYRMLQRLCYELGLLSVRENKRDYVYLSSGFAAQYIKILNGLGATIKKSLIPEHLRKESIIGMLSNDQQLFEKLDSCIDMAGRTLVNLSVDFKKMREYAFQDCLYRALLVNMYSDYIQIFSEYTINCVTCNGRLDFLITIKKPGDSAQSSPVAGSRQALVPFRQKAHKPHYYGMVLELKLLSLDDSTTEEHQTTQIKTKLAEAKEQLRRYNPHVKTNGGRKFSIAIIGCWNPSSFTVRGCWYAFDGVNDDAIYVKERSYPKVRTNSQH